jgi:hypothetical protein
VKLLVDSLATNGMDFRSIVIHPKLKPYSDYPETMSNSPNLAKVVNRIALITPNDESERCPARVR